MVAHLVRLKLTLLGNGLRRSPWQIIGLLLTVLYGVGLVVAVLIGLAALSVADAGLRADVLTVGGSLLVVGWWVIPLVFTGADATLDPGRFVTFAVPRRSLLVGLTLAAFVGVPGIATVLVALGTAGTWWRTPVALVVGLVGAVLGASTCVLGSRALATVLAPVVGARRFREVATVLVLIPLFLLGPIMSVLLEGLPSLGEAIPAVAAVAGWTPFGAPWTMAADAEAGRWWAMFGRLLVAVGSVAVLALVWDRSLQAALVRPPRASVARARVTGLGAFGRVPATPSGAVAARCLTYWIRDPRYAAGVVVVPLLPFLFAFIGGGPDGTLMLALGPVTAYLMGWAVSADIAYDSTAFWTHVAAPVRGRDDRVGRVLAAGVIGAPVALALTVLSLALTGRWEVTVPVVALTIAVLTTSLGLSSVVSAQVVYPVPAPGQSPFSSPQGGGTAAMLVQLAATVVLGVLLLPATGLTVAAVVLGSGWLVVGSVVVGTGLGVGFLLLGIRIGARRFDGRAPDLLQSLVSMS